MRPGRGGVLPRRGEHGNVAHVHVSCNVTVTCLLCALCALRRSSGGETMKWFGMPPTAPERVADRTHVEMKIVKKYPLFYIFVFVED